MGTIVLYGSAWIGFGPGPPDPKKSKPSTNNIMTNLRQSESTLHKNEDYIVR